MGVVCIAVLCRRVSHAFQCVAVCCSAWQKLEALLQCVAGCCRVLQCVVVCCSVLPTLLQCVHQAFKWVGLSRKKNWKKKCFEVRRSWLWQTWRFVLCYSVLQCVAVCCSVLQCVFGSQQVFIMVDLKIRVCTWFFHQIRGALVAWAESRCSCFNVSTRTDVHLNHY